MILGLTGSLGSGKSTVAGMLEEMGNARVIDADAISRSVQEPDGPAYGPILKEFGPGVAGDDGRLDRKQIAELVFADPKRLERLNSIVHPIVRREELRLLEEWAGEPLVVFMVPLLFENGLDRYTDTVAVVTVPDEVRLARLAASRGMSREEVERRLASQMPQAEKVRRADHIIDNGGSIEETQRQVAGLLDKLGIARQGAPQGAA